MQDILAIFAVFGITPQTGPKYILFGVIFFVTLYLVFRRTTDKLDERITRVEDHLLKQNAVLLLLGEEWMLPVKMFLYDNPTIQLDGKDIEHRDFYKAAAIYVRDKYLEAHPALP